MSESLKDFLLKNFGENIMQLLLPRVDELGCSEVQDLVYLEPEDVEDIQLSKIAYRKFLSTLQSLKEKRNDCGRQDILPDINEKIIEKENSPEIIQQGLAALNFFLTKNKIGLADFFRQQKKDPSAFNEMVEAIMLSLQENSDFPYNSLATFTFHRITRMQCLKGLLDKIKQECFLKKRIEFPLKTRKALIWTLLNNCTEELRLQILLLLSQFCPIPLLSLSEIQDNPFELKYNIIPEIYWILKPMPAMLCIDIGSKKQTKIINSFFGTDFDEDPLLDCGSVDIQFDINYKPPRRGFSVLRTDHHIQEKFLYQCVKFSSIYLLTVQYDALKECLPIIQNLYEKLQKYAEDIDEKPFFLMIVGLKGEDFLFEEETSMLFKQQNGLESFTKLKILVLPNQASNNSEMIQKITQSSMIKVIQAYIASKSPKVMNHIEFLDNFKITRYEAENRLVEDFLKTIIDNSEDFYNENFLPMYSHYSKYCKIAKKLSCDQIWQNQNQYNQLTGDLALLKNIMLGLDSNTSVKPTDILHQFVKVLSKENSFLLIYSISSRLKVFIDQRLAPEKKLYFDAKDQYHRLKSHDKTNPQLSEFETKVSSLQQTLEQKRLSLEIIWRELVQFYCYQHKACFDVYGEQCMMQILSKYTENGLPFEIIDGDNIRLSEKFLKTAILPRHKKVLVISIIGPQSSGKSTLLNYLFGCQFATSSGRCTKGIYGTLFDCSIGEYDGLLLLDTEGLFSPEKSDPEFDRKIVLFCFAVSHIVLINVRGDLNRNMQEVLTISLNVLDELKVSKVPSPTIFFVLNQNPDPNVENHLTAFNKIVESLCEEVDTHKMLNISAKTLVVLPSAFSDVCVYDEELTAKWIILTPSNIFGNECSSLLDKIWEEAELRMKKIDDCAPFSNIQEWNNFAQDIWSTIENFKGLIYLNEMKEIRQQEKVKAMIFDFVKKEFEEDAPAREVYNKILSIVKRNEKKDVAELELEQYWERKIAFIKPSWQACLKDLKLTPAVHERADYFFKSHINIQKSRSISRLHSQLEEMQARNDTINGETRIKQKIRSILNDHSHEITENEARNIFDKLFQEITLDMKKKQNIGKIQFTFKSQLSTQYHTICHKLPELNVICEGNDSIVFDNSCFSTQYSSGPDIFSKDILSNDYLNFSSQLFPVEPQSFGGVRILLALYSINWGLLFSDLKKLPFNLQIHNILWELSRGLFHLGLDLTGYCYRELEDYRRDQSGQKEPPHPKNNWITIISEKISFENFGFQKYLDIRSYRKSFEHYQNNGEILNFQEKKFFKSFFNILQYIGGKKNVSIQNKHTTYYSNGELVNKWLVNCYVETISLENLVSYCIKRIETEKIKMAIKGITTQALSGALKDSSQITTSILKFISSEIQNLAEKISRELEQLGLRLSLPGEARLHEYAFKQILKLASERSLEEQQKNIKIWIQERQRLEDFFISQVMVKKNEETDKALAQNIVKDLEVEIMRDLKTKSQIEYNIVLERNKDLFTRDTLQSVADAHLIDSNQPDLVFNYIIDPAKIFKQEFEKSWNNFLQNCSKEVLRTSKTACYSIDACVEFFKDIAEQLKKVYSKKEEIEIFKIDLTDGEDFSEEVSKSVRQAQSEAPFKCLGLFLNRDDYQDFKINGIFIETNLSLVWNIEIDQDEIQQDIFRSLSKESYQTYNLACFLHHFILQLEELSKRIKNITFEKLELSLQKNEMKLLAIGCTRTCPVCGRICDAYHGSNPGCAFDKHECKKGHQYQAMRGVRYNLTREAVLETCNDQKNESPWIWAGTRTTWGQMKELESLKEWNYDTLPSEQAVLNGKFYRAWMIAGDQICKHYNIIHHNHFGKKY